MQVRTLTPQLAVAPQISVDDVAALAAQGYRTLICNRPDGETDDQPPHGEIAAAATAAGMTLHYLPVAGGNFDDATIEKYAEVLKGTAEPVLAYCRSGTRSAMLWALGQAGQQPAEQILATAQQAGYDLSACAPRLAAAAPVVQAAPDAGKPASVPGAEKPARIAAQRYQIVVVGAGAAGISVAASLLKRDASLNIAIVDPAIVNYYQPGWTMVGGGIFTPEQTKRPMAQLIPNGVQWVQTAVASFEPEQNQITLEDGRVLGYDQLIVCPGLKIKWDAIPGVAETLGRNGVTSNYRYDLAPYTWQLVQQTKSGTALFTQPPMPIKCPGAPQKAAYLSCDHWLRSGVLASIKPQFHNAGAALFGVTEYVPALMDYVQKYGIDLQLGSNLVKVDGDNRIATFARKDADGNDTTTDIQFDMLHVVPPQGAPDCLVGSPIANAGGFVDVDQHTLQHVRYPNIHSLGDASGAPNSKTAAAARKQAPIVANNVLVALGRQSRKARYDGYGACPLTVERGKVVLAEFIYGGKVAPTLPTWLVDGLHATRAAWQLKAHVMPALYWHGMLKGREIMVSPKLEG